MRTAADYFGLMAYIWVMSGGMPEADLLSPAGRETVPAKPRNRRRLRVIEGERLREAAPAAELHAEDAAA